MILKFNKKLNIKFNNRVIKILLGLAFFTLGLFIANFFSDLKFNILAQYFQPRIIIPPSILKEFEETARSPSSSLPIFLPTPSLTLPTTVPPSVSSCLNPTQSDRDELMRWGKSFANNVNKKIISLLQNPDTSEFIPKIQKRLDSMTFRSEREARDSVINIAKYGLSLGFIKVSGQIKCETRKPGKNFCYPIYGGGQSDPEPIFIDEIKIEGTVKVKIAKVSLGKIVKDIVLELPIRMVIKGLNSESKLNFGVVEGKIKIKPESSKVQVQAIANIQQLISKFKSFRADSIEIIVQSRSEKFQNQYVNFGFIITCRF